MTGTVIDIVTGKKISETEMAEREKSALKFPKRILEISAPDGRTVFSINRLLEKSEDEYKQKYERNKVAA